LITFLRMLFNELENSFDPQETEEVPLQKQESNIKEPKFDGSIKLAYNIDCRDEIFCCEMSPSGNLIAAGTNKGITRIFDVDKGKFFP